MLKWIHCERRPMKLQINDHSPLKVLIIDDNPDSIKIITYILDKFPTQIFMSYDGVNIAPLLAQEHFDLILLDWNMPIMNGRETLYLINEMTKNKQLPIVIYTAEDKDNIDLPLLENIKYLGLIDKTKSYHELAKQCGNFFEENQ